MGLLLSVLLIGLPWWLGIKESACNVGDAGLIPGSGRSSGEGNGNPLQDSGLGNSKDRGVWQATVHGVARVRHNLVTKPPPPYLTTVSVHIIRVDHISLQVREIISIVFSVVASSSFSLFFMSGALISRRLEHLRLSPQDS